MAPEGQTVLKNLAKLNKYACYKVNYKVRTAALSKTCPILYEKIAAKINKFLRESAYIISENMKT